MGRSVRPPHFYLCSAPFLLERSARQTYLGVAARDQRRHPGRNAFCLRSLQCVSPPSIPSPTRRKLPPANPSAPASPVVCSPSYGAGWRAAPFSPSSRSSTIAPSPISASFPAISRRSPTAPTPARVVPTTGKRRDSPGRYLPPVVWVSPREAAAT